MRVRRRRPFSIYWVHDFFYVCFRQTCRRRRCCRPYSVVAATADCHREENVRRPVGRVAADPRVIFAVFQRPPNAPPNDGRPGVRGRKADEEASPKSECPAKSAERPLITAPRAPFFAPRRSRGPGELAQPRDRGGSPRLTVRRGSCRTECSIAP